MEARNLQNILSLRSRRERRENKPAVQSCSLFVQGSLFRSHSLFASCYGVSVRFEAKL
jgi:hypothetical protein